MKLFSPRTILLAATALLPLAACSSPPPPTPVAAMTPPPPPALPAQDMAFVTSVAQANAAEIAAAQLAETNGTPAIRRFAARMITDHTDAGQKLMALAQSKNVALPAGPDDAHLQMAASMQNLKGRAFDKQYMDGQVADHRTVVQTFQNEIQNGTDPDVKAFAQQNLPTMQQHLALAQRLDPRRA